MKRPELNKIPFDNRIFVTPGAANITMAPGQWDTMLQAAYDRGWTLIEVDRKTGEGISKGARPWMNSY